MAVLSGTLAPLIPAIAFLCPRGRDTWENGIVRETMAHPLLL
jgi:hypothetical protein